MSIGNVKFHYSLFHESSKSQKAFGAPGETASANLDIKAYPDIFITGGSCKNLETRLPRFARNDSRLELQSLRGGAAGNKGMKVAIAGAGMTGAYLYRLLKNEGREADLFDRGQVGRCGLT